MDIRPIRTNEDHDAALREIERLWGSPVGSEDDDKRDVLATLVEAYEQRHGTADTRELFAERVNVLDEKRPGWRDHYAPGIFGCHEALDRTARIMDLVYDLGEYPGVVQKEDWHRKAATAFEQLHALYQAIGAAIPDGSPAP